MLYWSANHAFKVARPTDLLLSTVRYNPNKMEELQKHVAAQVSQPVMSALPGFNIT